MSDRNYESVRNWVQGNKPLVRSESSLFMQPVKDGDIVALRDVSRSKGVISKLLDKVVPLLPRVASNKVCSLLFQRVKNPFVCEACAHRLTNEISSSPLRYQYSL